MARAKLSEFRQKKGVLNDGTPWVFLLTGEQRNLTTTAGVPRRDEKGDFLRNENGEILSDPIDLTGYTVEIKTIRQWTRTTVTGTDSQTLNVKYGERFKGDAVRDLAVTIGPGQDKAETRGRLSFVVPKDLMNDVTIELDSDQIPVAIGFLTVTNPRAVETILKRRFVIFYREGIAKDNI